MMYRLTDPFCLFYLSNVSGHTRSENFWRDNENLPSLSIWRGRAFENLCLLHLTKIKRALGIEGVACEASAWTMRGTENESEMTLVTTYGLTYGMHSGVFHSTVTVDDLFV